MSSPLVFSKICLNISTLFAKGSSSYLSQNDCIRNASVFDRIEEFSLYSLFNYYKVSQFYTQPMIPVLCDNGITEYLVITRSLHPVSGSFDNSLSTKENNCITLSSYLKSSCPFKRKWYSFPSLP